MQTLGPQGPSFDSVQAFQVVRESWRSQNSINLGPGDFGASSVSREGAFSFPSLKPGDLVAIHTLKLHALSTDPGKRKESSLSLLNRSQAA